MVTSFNKGSFESIGKRTPHGKKGLIKKKKKASQNFPINPRNLKSTTHVFFAFPQSHSRISYFRPLIDFQNQENTFVVYF